MLQNISVTASGKVFYVAGPMRGHPEFNHPAFHAAAAKLRDKGHEVFNPAERDFIVGLDVTGLAGLESELVDRGFSIREAMAADCLFLCKQATHVYLLPGWSTSKGAIAERFLAVALGLTIEGATQ